MNGSMTAAQQRDRWVEGAGQPAPLENEAPALATQAAPAPQLAMSEGFSVHAKPSTNFSMVGEAATRTASYMEIVDRLQPLIDEQLAGVQAVMEADGVEAPNVDMVLAIDITGEEKIVCTYCGRPNCNYKPTTYRSDNPERNLLTDGLVVFMEVAEALGINYGVIAYDDQDVVPVRVLAPVDGQPNDRALVRDRFEGFAGRHENPEITRAWLDEMLAKWTPKDRTRPQAGEPDDGTAFTIAQRMFNEASHDGTPVRGLVVAKSLPPLKSFMLDEMSLRNEGIAVNGLAVGHDAQQVAANFFEDTDVAEDPHEFKERMGARMQKALEEP